MKNDNFSKYIQLFTTFFKIGLFTFGGGYAMIPLIERETVEKKKWVTDTDILDIIAVAESTPGPIAINSATFVGYRTAGFFGAFFATLGVVLPSFVIIYLISIFLHEFADYKIVKYAFFGIRAGVIALIAGAVVKMAKQLPENLFSYLIAICAFSLVVFFKLNVLVAIFLSAVVGLCFSFNAKQGGEK